VVVDDVENDLEARSMRALTTAWNSWTCSPLRPVLAYRESGAKKPMVL
jgi:hypothetical protein